LHPAPGQPPAPVNNSDAKPIPFEAKDFIKLKPGQKLGEVLGVTVDSRGDVAILYIYMTCGT